MDEPTNIVEPDTPETGKGLRAKLEAEIAQKNKYKTQLMANAYDDLGLKADEGLGKAIAKEYDGEPTREALANYAKDEYGYEYVPPNVVEANPMAEAIAQEQAALDQVGSTAGSVVAPTEQELLAKAEAEGDVDTSFAIKANQVASFFQNP